MGSAVGLYAGLVRGDDGSAYRGQQSSDRRGRRRSSHSRIHRRLRNLDRKACVALLYCSGRSLQRLRRRSPARGGDWWKMGGGGSVWDGMAYDSETNTVFAGTGNAEPWVEKFRGAKGLDNLYTCSIVALDANTGKLKWHY